MKRLYNKFIDLIFYSRMFKQSRKFHYDMAYGQGRFDYIMSHLNSPKYEYMEGTYED